MFCYQCEQTAKGQGCEKIGVCGKTHDVATLQDLLIYALQGLGQVAVAGRKVGINEDQVNIFTVRSLFATLTNVNFDPDRLAGLIKECVALRDSLGARVKSAGGQVSSAAGPATYKPAATMEGLIDQGLGVGLKSYPAANADVMSLKHTLLFGIKGVSAYADHAEILGQKDDVVYAFVHEALASLPQAELSLDDCLKLVLKCGEINLRTMELLDTANTGTYGQPVPTKVPLGAKQGKAILVSGHDLKDLHELLKQTEGKGINIYTHGEMLPT
ncbi:MAG: hydroxylamine reductase, partial [Deltaproteobacteria bacterium]|nr:hydroxylamine reductase [Deltaproteobacteria bacterium]